MLRFYSFLTQTASAFISEISSILIWGYVLQLGILCMAFLIIYSMDEYEYQNNLQTCYEFKCNMWFVFMFSKNKRFVSKKTFILELIGYALLAIVTVIFAISFHMEAQTACLLLAGCVLILIVFACVARCFEHKSKKRSR